MSYKIFVVEDEPPILRGIIKKINDSGIDFVVCGSAYNGEDALSEIERLNPDVVFTDIRMPIMGGLQLVDNIKKGYPNIICVIISGHQEFDYARQAVKLGVDDYLIKPLSIESLNLLLNNLIIKLEEAFQEKSTALFYNVLRYDLPGSILASLGFAGFSLMHILVGNSLSSIQGDMEYREKIKTVWSCLDLNALAKGAKYWVLNGKYPNEKVLVAACFHENMEPLTHIERYISTKMPYGTFITIAKSDVVKDFGMFAIEAEKVRKMAVNNSRQCKNTIIDSYDVNNKDILHLLTAYSHEEQKLSMFIRNGQYRLVWKELSFLLKFWEDNAITCRVLENNLRLVARLIVAKKRVGESISVDPERLVQNILCKCSSMNEVRDEYITAMKSISDINTKETEKDNHKDIADRALEFIEKKYAQKISLRDIASEFKLTESYLCKIFKKFKNESPIDYLLKFRVSKSKQLLLENPDLMMKDIAQLVGFSDQYYFSRIFKCLVKMTPSEYRNSQSR